MPHDTETERSVLATIMRYDDTYLKVSDILSPEIFYYDRERAIYNTIAGLLEDGQVPDINALYDWASSHDVGAKLERMDFMEIRMSPSQQTLTQDALRLVDLCRRRQCWKLLMMAAANSVDKSRNLNETIEGIITALNDLQRADTNKGIYPFKVAVDELREIVEQNNKGNTLALKTGFYLFDEKSLLRPGTLTIIAAFTSVGKSALAMNIATNVARSGDAVAYYSLEMGKAELAARVLAVDANTPASIIMNKRLMESQYADFKHSADKNEGLPIYIDESSTITFDRTVRSIRRMSKTHGVKLAIIDYLQIYTQTGDNVEASLAQMARQAKNIAKEANIAVIMLSQLNRSSPKPALNMMRGSGQIEESADNIVLIDRPDAYNPDKQPNEMQDAKFILAKGRGVGTMQEDARFKPITTQFESKCHPNTDQNSENPEDQLPF